MNTSKKVKTKIPKITKKLFNEMEEVFSKPIIDTPEGNYKCPACGSVFLSKSNINEHMLERSCYDVRASILDTNIEEKLYSIHSGYLNSFGDNTSVKSTRSWFRKYCLNRAICIYSRCLDYNIDMLEYFEYIISKQREDDFSFIGLNSAMVNNAYFTANTNGNIERFMEWRRANRHFFWMNNFLKKHQKQIEDTSFMIKAFTRGEVTYKYMERWLTHNNRIDTLTQSELSIISEFFNKNGEIK